MHIRQPEVIFHPPPQEQPRCQGARTQRRGPQRGGAPPAGAPPRVSAPPASQPEPVVSLTLSAYSVECEAPLPDPPTQGHPALHSSSGCLLYTSDAADDLLCVDLGGRRIIKKKKNKHNKK